MKRPRLGRGLDAMLPPLDPPPTRQVSQVPPAEATGRKPRPASPPRSALIEEVHPNRAQPRRTFDSEALEELTASIRELGVLEPILVRSRDAGGFEIIAGERRWRAAQRAGLKEVPIFVRDLSDKSAFEAALVENLQREDLNPIETSRAFHRLIEEFGHSQESVAGRVGKDRSTVSNALRLLKLPSGVLDMVENGELTEGHGRAILSAPDTASMERMARKAVELKWSVRETERQARSKAPGGSLATPAKKSANIRDLERRLGHSLGTTVVVRDRHGKGRLEVAFASYEELDRIIVRLLG